MMQVRIFIFHFMSLEYSACKHKKVACWHKNFASGNLYLCQHKSVVYRHKNVACRQNKNLACWQLNVGNTWFFFGRIVIWLFNLAYQHNYFACLRHYPKCQYNYFACEHSLKNLNKGYWNMPSLLFYRYHFSSAHTAG